MLDKQGCCFENVVLRLTSDLVERMDERLVLEHDLGGGLQVGEAQSDEVLFLDAGQLREDAQD